MKEVIHPQWHEDAKVFCVCGHTFSTGSTLTEIHTEICSQCHPFFTGKEKLIDIEGLVEKFEKKRAAGQKTSSEKKLAEKDKKEKQKKDYHPKSLKEMMEYASKQKAG